jgi:putative transposase
LEKRYQHPGRKHPAHHPVIERFNRASVVFVTVCSKNRKPIFTREAVHELMMRAWRKADQWMVGRYVLMPDHIHFFCSPVGLEYPPLKKWITFWKSMVSRNWPNPEEQPIWQTDFWDTQLRKGDSYSGKWHYVRNNPVRAGLVGEVDDWPYQGTMETLFWQE